MLFTNDNLLGVEGCNKYKTNKKIPDHHKTMKLSSTNFVLVLEKQPIRTLYTINTKNVLKSFMTEMNLFNNYIIIIYCLNVFN